MGKGGAGGYGGISTFNTDQRVGAYYPHKSPTKYTDMMTDTTSVLCLHCKGYWQHSRGDRTMAIGPEMPNECREDLFRPSDA